MFLNIVLYTLSDAYKSFIFLSFYQNTANSYFSQQFFSTMYLQPLNRPVLNNCSQGNITVCGLLLLTDKHMHRFHAYSFVKFPVSLQRYLFTLKSRSQCCFLNETYLVCQFYNNMYHKLPSFKEVIELPALFCMDHFVIKINNKTTHKHIHTSKHIKKFKKKPNPRDNK